MPHDKEAQALKPAQHTLSAEQSEILKHCLTRFASEPGGLLPLLHAVQDALGHIPRAAVPVIAAAFNLSRAEVHGVVSYYPHFREQPIGQNLLQICRAEACQSRGADALLAHAQQALSCSSHGASHSTSADGQVTLEPVYCLGLCAQSPAVMVNEHEVHAQMTTVSLDKLLQQLRSGEYRQKQAQAHIHQAQAAMNFAILAAEKRCPHSPWHCTA